MDRTIKVTGITYVSFGFYYFLNELLFNVTRDWLGNFTHQLGISHAVAYILMGTPLFVGALLITSKKSFWDGLGLSRSPRQGMGVALFFTMPMFVGYAFLFHYNSDITLNNVIRGAISAGFFEEFYCRAFLFGMLYRYALIGFIPAVILDALLFTLGHLKIRNALK